MSRLADRQGGEEKEEAQEGWEYAGCPLAYMVSICSWLWW